MANLRTNNLSGEQGQNAYRGSVFFNATPNAGLQMLSSDFAFGTGDFTVEGWFWYSGDGATIASIFDSRTTDTTIHGFFVGVNSSGKFYTYGFPAGTAESAHNTIPPNSGWHHFAIVRSGNDGFRFLNGQQVGSTEDMSSTNYTHSGGVVGQPSNIFNTSFYRWKGYLSNIRVHKGEAIYTSNFTPPTTELKATSSNCVLLCCQNSDDPTQDATGKTITAQNLISDQPKVIPPFGVDAGNTFGGPIKKSSQGYMYFPTGRTEERGRGRAVAWLGADSPSYTKQIDFFDIQSTGTTTKFGEISDTVGLGAGMSSSTRGVFAGGTKPAAGNQNLLEFITIATTGNAIDFGGVSTTFRYGGGISNSTRGLICGAYQGGGASGTKNVIQFITIATLGDTADFGDIIANSNNGIFGAGTCQSSTRGITFGGGTGPSQVNEINSIEIGTLGNSVDFGDLSSARLYMQGVSSSTRGVVAGGYQESGSPSMSVIEFITIASTGDATDFGDLITAARLPGSTGGSNKIRGVFVGGGVHPSYYNTIEFVTIATTGNASDFGDISTGNSYGSVAVSDSHGGLS